MINELTEHPFQLSQIEYFPYCQGINFYNDENATFEDYVRDLEPAFHQAVADGGYLSFAKKYTEISTQMLNRKCNVSIMRPLLDNALTRLFIYINFLRLRSRPNLFESSSVQTFNIDTAMLAEAKNQTDKMEQQGIKNLEYDLNRSQQLKRWVREKLQPIIEEYVGFKVVSPSAELRFSDSKLHGDTWSNAYRHHKYGNYHLDQSCYALPFIIYLDDVAESDGPFTYVNNSDKLSQNYILRAFHQTLTFHNGLGGQSDEDFTKMGNLPSVFRGGDLVGTFAGPKPFETNQVVNLTGPAGTAALFGGFHLVHSGGHPISGARKSLFVNFRYPRFKVSEMFGKAASLRWRYQTRSIEA